jgi:catechol 2,3-dioxygenase-like lactoylglutathione lyase family enzyme
MTRRGGTVLDKLYLININVSDMDRSVRFYEHLGLSKVSDHIHDSAQIGEMWGIENFASLRLCWMALHENVAPMLDLVQLLEPPPDDEPKPSLQRVGAQRIVFIASDIEALHARLVEIGAEILSPLQETVGHEGQVVKTLYFKDPDGTLLEAMWYPDPPKAAR